METTFRKVSSKCVSRNESDPLSLNLINIQKIDGMNVVGLIIFFAAIGLALSYLGEKGKPLADVCIAFNHVVILLIGLIMWSAPFGIASLIASEITQMRDLPTTLRILGLYLVTVILGLTLHLFGTVSLIYRIALRKNPYIFLQRLLPAAKTALVTSSSAATLTTSFRCLEANGIDGTYTAFVLPIGTMINMDGTALYEAVAPIFIAQINGINLSWSQVVTISITAILASIGVPSISSGGLVTMVVVLTTVGLPTDDISIIYIVDWLM